MTSQFVDQISFCSFSKGGLVNGANGPEFGDVLYVVRSNADIVMRWSWLFGQKTAALSWSGGLTKEGGPKAAVHSGLASALGSHPCVALSCYQANRLYGRSRFE